MAEMSMNKPTRQMKIRHRGRGAQIPIYFGKLLRMFVYQNDWKVLPMAALIAGLVGMVVRNKFFINMEGTLMGAFAIVCVCIWNGCFNSIQVICRERDVIKREHRSGMHISSYIVSHMMYQALLCLAQTIVTLYVTRVVGVQYPFEGVVTPLFMLDFIISMFLITYASDMLSLWVSTLAKNTTTAMTIMPFVLIFQLVFSGGMLTLPAWTEPLTHFTISNPGLKVIAAQADTNNRPYATISSMVGKMRNSEIGGTFTVGQVLDVLQQEDNPTIAELRSKEIGQVMTLGEIKTALESSATFDAFRKEHLIEDVTVEDAVRYLMESEEAENVRNFSFGLQDVPTLGEFLQSVLDTEETEPIKEKKILQLTTVGDVLDAIDAAGLMEKYGDTEIGGTFTLGEAIDFLAENPDVQARREQEITVHTTVGKVLDIVGEEKVMTFLEEKAAAVSYTEDYECTEENIGAYWMQLLMFVFVFALFSMITLEFIDKDKR